MYAFVNVKGGPGRAFEQHCRELGTEPGTLIAAMVENFVASKNMTMPPPENFGEGLDRFVGLYVKMRDTKSALKKAFDKEEEAIKEQMAQVEVHLLKTLNDNGAKSMNTDQGTFYKEKVLKPSVSDWSVFYDYVRREDAFHLLERRVTKKGVETYMEEQGEPPPGVSTMIEYEVRVRRGKEN